MEHKMKDVLTYKPKVFSNMTIYILLISLYTLQGIIIGLFLDTIEIMLKKHFTFSQLGVYMLCKYPFSLKIIWSPIIDTYSIKSIGLRKSWIIPIQMLIALLLYMLSNSFDLLVNNNNLSTLTFFALVIMVLIATQDIVVDGWGVSLCGKEVSYLYMIYVYRD
jgi:phage-related holin